MAKRPVRWYEGMFLKPHHFQAADRYLRERVRESEDWLHPYNWGLAKVELGIATDKNQVVLRSCQARFKDGTTLSVPEEASVSPVELHDALKNTSETTVYLAIPTWKPGRPNVQMYGASHELRYASETVEWGDEDTGIDPQPEPVEFLNIHARLLLSNVDNTGYEVLPVARIKRSAEEGSPPKIDPWYVPPVLGLDTWVPLHREVRALHEQIGAWITMESDLLVGRKISFDSQVLGDADRVLRLSFLNTAYSLLQSIISTRGLHPLEMYRELCRLVGQVSIFSDKRRPIDVPGYDHENIGPIYATAIREIRRLLGEPGRVTYEKRYFQLVGKLFQVTLDPDWTLDTAKLYIGVETTELSDAECDELMNMTNWKLGSGEQVEEIFRGGAGGLKMKPLNRIPPALPAGVVYFEIDRSPNYWRDVVRTQSLGLRFKLERGKFLSNTTFALTNPKTQQTVNLQFAVFVVKPD